MGGLKAGKSIKLPRYKISAAAFTGGASMIDSFVPFASISLGGYGAPLKDSPTLAPPILYTEGGVVALGGTVFSSPATARAGAPARWPRAVVLDGNFGGPLAAGIAADLAAYQGMVCQLPSPAAFSPATPMTDPTLGDTDPTRYKGGKVIQAIFYFVLGYTWDGITPVVYSTDTSSVDTATAQGNARDQMRTVCEEVTTLVFCFDGDPSGMVHSKFVDDTTGTVIWDVDGPMISLDETLPSIVGTLGGRRYYFFQPTVTTYDVVTEDPGVSTQTDTFIDLSSAYAFVRDKLKAYAATSL